MPKITSLQKYNAVLQASNRLLLEQGTKDKLFTYEIPEGTAVYRYISYRDSDPQIADSARKVWSPLKSDTENRWTGIPSDQYPQMGTQGLYLSIEAAGVDTTQFAELEHYLTDNTTEKQEISYYNYTSGKPPELKIADVSSLRSLFLFTFKEVKKGVDLRLSNTPSRDFLQRVLDEARKANPGVFNSTDTLDSLYKNPEDASFCRAIGNSVFTTYPDVPLFCTTSVRSDTAENMIHRAPDRDLSGSAQAIDVLNPQGRISWYLDPATITKHGIAVYTLDDMVYNGKIEDKELSPDIKEYKETLDKFKQSVEQIKQNDLIPKLNETIKKLNWDIIQKNVDSAVKTRVQQILKDELADYTKQGGSSPFVNIDDHVKKLKADDWVQSSMTSALQNVTLSLITCDDGFKEAIKNGQKEINKLLIVNPDFPDPSLDEACKVLTYSIISDIISSTIVATKLEAINKETAGHSYISDIIKSNVLDQRKYYVDQNRSIIESNLAKATTTATATNKELVAKKTAMQTLEQQISKDPSNPSLASQKNSVQKEIDTLVMKLEEDEKAKDELEDLNKDKSSEKRQTDEKKEEEGKEIFKEHFGE
jgi:hypothetical protein